MSMLKTSKGIKKFTDKEKLSIIKESETAGVKPTLHKYDLYPATFYYWKKKITDAGTGAISHGITAERLSIIRDLQKENTALKQIVAEKELESKLKDEMLKKKYPHLRKLL